MGLDKTLYEQFFVYVSNLINGNLGTSLSTGQPVLDDLTKRLPASLELTILSLLLSCLVSIPLGILAATKPPIAAPINNGIIINSILENHFFGESTNSVLCSRQRFIEKLSIYRNDRGLHRGKGRAGQHSRA